MGAVAAMSYADIKAMAQDAASSGVCGTSNVGECVMRIMRGVELGFSPAMALQAWHNMKGNLVLKSDFHVAVCLKRPDLCERFELTEHTDERCTYAVKRVGKAEALYTFDLERAKKAGLLSNPTWQKHPRAMLRARAGVEAARAEFPDLVGGLYDEDEGREIAEDRPARRPVGRYKAADAAPSGAPQLPPAPRAVEAATVEGEAVPQGYMTPGEALAAVEACESSRSLDDLNVKLRAAKGISGWTPADTARIREKRDARAAELVAEGK